MTSVFGQIIQIKLILLTFITLFLPSCNLANSADEDNLSKNASAKLTVQSAIPSANAEGYYQENSLLTLNASGRGSLDSAITCVITVQKKLDSTTSYTDVNVINGCGEQAMDVDNGAGVYRIKLLVTDGNSKTAEARTTLIVEPSSISSEPYLSANFTAIPSSLVGHGFDVALDATSSTKGVSGDIATYTWQVRKKENDATTNLISTVGPMNSPVTNVVVPSDGIYVVQLDIVDDGAKTASTAKTFSVRTGADTLVADFSLTIPAGQVPINITADSSSSTVTNIDNYAWDVFLYTDLATSLYHVETESTSVNLPIGEVGIYIIRLRVIDSIGNEHEVSRTFQVS